MADNRKCKSACTFLHTEQFQEVSNSDRMWICISNQSISSGQREIYLRRIFRSIQWQSITGSDDVKSSRKIFRYSVKLEKSSGCIRICSIPLYRRKTEQNCIYRQNNAHRQKSIKKPQLWLSCTGISYSKWKESIRKLVRTEKNKKIKAERMPRHS